MALNKVQPGDLITAQLMNELLDKVRELENRLALIEANAPQDGPPSGLRLDVQPVAPGAWAVLLGQTLGASKRTLQIRFDNIYVLEYDATMFSDMAVRFRVPDLTFLEVEKTYTMYVANHRGQSQLAVQVRRPLVPLNPNDFALNYLGATPPLPVAGLPASFRIQIELSANRPVDLVLEASVVRPGQPNIPIQVQDDIGNSLPNRTLVFTGIGNRVVRLPVSQVPNPPFSLRLSASAEGLASFVFEHPITNLADVPDERILFQPVIAKRVRPGLPPVGFPVTDTGVECVVVAPSGSSRIQLEINADLTSPTTAPYADQTYSWSIVHVAGTPNQWTMDPASGSKTVTAASFGATNGVAAEEIEPSATPIGSPTAESHYLLTWQRTGETRKRTKLLRLSRAQS